GTYTLTSGQLDLTGQVTIQGAGSGATVIDAGGASRAFQVDKDAVAEIDGVSIVDGNSGQLAPATCPALGFSDVPGGAILDAGTLTLRGDSISDSIADGSGGAIEDLGNDPLTIADTALSHNTSCATDDSGAGLGFGGGVDDSGTAAMTISDATITDNTAAGFDGGGVAESGGATVTLTDSTISGNAASSSNGSFVSGGGIAAEGGGIVDLSGDTLTANTAGGAGGGMLVGIGMETPDSASVVDTTITANTAAAGGGIDASNGGSVTISFATIDANTATAADFGAGNLGSGGEAPGRFTLDDSIIADGVGAAPIAAVAGSSSPSNCGAFQGSFTSTGHNLFDGDGAQCGAVDSDIVDADPDLGPLANNGGPTETMAL
ncbi:MAG TPA: right-handed parallel beta-helix repeat-containing protein, partial [Thermomicrobiales bacterium]|nr:right-handed parallel beta-helix repeat-containing protein [Thermomicrobiales bacterium]